MKFTAVDMNHARSECGRYTITRAPGAQGAISGCQVVYTLWNGQDKVSDQRCKNFASERTEAMTLLIEDADAHAGGARP